MFHFFNRVACWVLTDAKSSTLLSGVASRNAVWTQRLRRAAGLVLRQCWHIPNLSELSLKRVCHKRNVVDCFDFSAAQAFLNDAQVQKALGVPVGLAWRPCNLQVDSAFVRSGDYMSSTDGLVAELLERGVPVLAYSGDTDLMVDWLGTKGWMEKLAWRGQSDWVAAPLRTFHVHNKSAGREKSYGGFTFLQVFESGHLVPKDQPEVALMMLRRFVSLHSDWAAAPPAVLQSGPKDLGLRTQSSREPAFLAGLSALLGALCLAWALRLWKRKEPEGQYSLMT
ncbi:CPY1 [Symbiodinium sp. CCMP2592]|nr:CPY1 [Symbiodinium sp. CCMP2592]